VLASIAYLLDRLLHDKSRADELQDLRKRLQASQPAARVSHEEAVLAIELRDLRAQILLALGQVQTCRSCARGHPYPHGRWEGGHCCGGVTAHLFTDDEVASLRAAGTTPWHLRVPHADHAGCSFRGPEGCSLRAEHRPNLCVRYTCPDLRNELRARGDLQQIDRLCDRLFIAFKQFAQARARRREDEVFEELLSGRG
jgi:hypothetical protein